MNARTVRACSYAAATGLVAVAAFQCALALGAPWGAAAWGGAYTRLPPGLRAGSAISALVLAGAAPVVLARANADRHDRSTNRLLGAATWALAGLLTLSSAGNFASASGWERRVQAPLALVIAALCLVVARAGARNQSIVTRAAGGRDR